MSDDDIKGGTSDEDAAQEEARPSEQAPDSPPGEHRGAGDEPMKGDERAQDEPNESAGDEPKQDAQDTLRGAEPPIGRKARVRGGLLFFGGALTTFLLMANVGQVAHGALYGLAAMLVATYGLLEALGFIREDASAKSWRNTVLGRLEGEPAWAQPRVMGLLTAVVLLAVGVGGGYETLPWAIGLALLTLVPPALRRPGLLVFVLVGLIYLPLLGTFGLWDPWETHYGEVAREIVARDDWISLWWAQENWFWSKPILIFWSEAFTFSALNVDVMPDANPGHPEWAVRLPVALFAMAAVMTVYGTIRRLFGTRAGVLAALVLATMPHFFFLSHQAITDMYLVSNLVMAVCMLMLAFATAPDEEGGRVRIFGRAWSLQAVVLGGIVLLALPQALYLISRNVDLIPWEGFRVHRDSFLYGSAGNPGGLGVGQVPGNPAHRDQLPAVESLQPFVQGLVWLACLGGLLFMLRRERRTQALAMTAFYAFCALAFMGKGIPGIALPGLVALFYLVASRRWNVLLDGQLRVAPGALVVTTIGLPWYVAMYVRHGPGFTDRLLVHDHINRLAQGVHGDTGSIQYFIWQLGYATFPWVGLIPAAALGWLWLRSGDRATDAGGPYRIPASRSDGGDVRQQTLMLLGIWFFSSFALFSAMITKFHHYIFPAVPPAAIAVGILLDRLWGRAKGDARTRRVATIAAVVSALPLTLGLGSLWGNLRGYVPEDVPNAEKADWVLEHGWPTAASYALILLGAALLGWAAKWLWDHRPDESRDGVAAHTELSLSVAVAAGAVVVAFVGRDLSWVTSARPQGYERLIHLFVYNYGRPWPEEFDYRPILTGIAVVAGLLFGLCALRWVRAAAARALLGLALLFGAWALNVYMPDLARHWGMRELFKTYYEQRSGPEEPIVAWQMNWKGENFYTGNRVFAFVDLDNQKLREWMRSNRGKTAFFVFEHTRLGSFRNLMRGKEIEEITDKRVCNKFMVVRVRDL